MNCNAQMMASVIVSRVLQVNDVRNARRTFGILEASVVKHVDVFHPVVWEILPVAMPLLALVFVNKMWKVGQNALKYVVNRGLVSI